MQKLSDEERQSLVLQHRRERDKRICDRIKAVLLRDEGWTYEQIAHVLLLTKEAIRQHIDDYEERSLNWRYLVFFPHCRHWQPSLYWAKVLGVE